MACLEQVVETSYLLPEGTEETSPLGHTAVTWAFLQVTDWGFTFSVD